MQKEQGKKVSSCLTQLQDQNETGSMGQIGKTDTAEKHLEKCSDETQEELCGLKGKINSHTWWWQSNGVGTLNEYCALKKVWN